MNFPVNLVLNKSRLCWPGKTLASDSAIPASFLPARCALNQINHHNFHRDFKGYWCCGPAGLVWGEKLDPVLHDLLLIRDFCPALVWMTVRNTRQAVGQDLSKSVTQWCLVLWPDYEKHLPCAPHTSPLHFNWYLPYLLLFKSTSCKHTQTYATTVFSVPFKNPLYCKSCWVQSCWRPVNLPLLRQSITEVRIQYFFGGLWSSLLG